MPVFQAAAATTMLLWIWRASTLLLLLEQLVSIWRKNWDDEGQKLNVFFSRIQKTEIFLI